MAHVELCQICKKAPATISVTQILNGEKKHLMLCEKCAEAKGALHSLSDLSSFFEKALSGVLGIQLEKPEPRGEELECPGCHMTLSRFEREGLLGCPQCYETFKDELAVLLRRMHGSNKHIGTQPRHLRSAQPRVELEKLRQQLRLAVESEKYELAAKYRDMIKNIERDLLRDPSP
jgi:protein arginine kinase activator